jgi:hypothetical protein
MGNKKKPSTVTLSYSSDFQFEPSKGALLLPEMLSWPIFEQNGYTKLGEVRSRIHINVLSALLKIEPFDSVVSLRVDEKKERFIRADKTHGEIFLNGESVVGLDYHSKKKNKLYISLEEWPELELDYQVSSVESCNDWNRVYKTLSKWSVDQWIEFFFKRIKDKAESLNKKAQAKRSDAQILEDRAIRMLEAFS